MSNRLSKPLPAEFNSIGFYRVY
ncbi:hypothetical protein VTL71DRAFT_12570 [Oculimacula yallundae]|uniref:Uncharacterized protein n=1 Tax=Oculimacula yallundae TaxID=86028 RepID=A0ABR4CNF7_9HELO